MSESKKVQSNLELLQDQLGTNKKLLSDAISTIIQRFFINAAPEQKAKAKEMIALMNNSDDTATDMLTSVIEKYGKEDDKLSIKKLTEDYENTKIALTQEEAIINNKDIILDPTTTSERLAEGVEEIQNSLSTEEQEVGPKSVFEDIFNNLSEEDQELMMKLAETAHDETLDHTIRQAAADRYNAIIAEKATPEQLAQLNKERANASQSEKEETSISQNSSEQIKVSNTAEYDKLSDVEKRQIRIQRMERTLRFIDDEVPQELLTLIRDLYSPTDYKQAKETEFFKVLRDQYGIPDSLNFGNAGDTYGSKDAFEIHKTEELTGNTKKLSDIVNDFNPDQDRIIFIKNDGKTSPNFYVPSIIEINGEPLNQIPGTNESATGFSELPAHLQRRRRLLRAVEFFAVKADIAKAKELSKQKAENTVLEREIYDLLKKKYSLLDPFNFGNAGTFIGEPTEKTTKLEELSNDQTLTTTYFDHFREINLRKYRIEFIGNEANSTKIKDIFVEASEIPKSEVALKANNKLKYWLWGAGLLVALAVLSGVTNNSRKSSSSEVATTQPVIESVKEKTLEQTILERREISDIDLAQQKIQDTKDGYEVNVTRKLEVGKNKFELLTDGSIYVYQEGAKYNDKILEKINNLNINSLGLSLTPEQSEKVQTFLSGFTYNGSDEYIIVAPNQKVKNNLSVKQVSTFEGKIVVNLPDSNPDSSNLKLRPGTIDSLAEMSTQLIEKGVNNLPQELDSIKSALNAKLAEIAKSEVIKFYTKK